MTTGGDDAAARAAWLGDLLDLDTVARERALAAADTPPEWRHAGRRMCALESAEGILDRDADALARRVLGTCTAAIPAAGSHAGRWRLQQMIGAGGMATVWLARHEDPELPQQVAVKCLRSTLSTPEWRERFLREQRILARLNHPNITRLYDAGITVDGEPYIVMEYIAGEAISDYCRRVAPGCEARVRMFLKVCEAVAYAHRNLIVHRDLKPRNVLVSDDGEPHLLDFGIAKLLDPADSDADNTRTGLSLLTPAYAAPEQFSRQPVTTTTDVYGLGAMLHELLTGTRALHHADGRLQSPSGRAPTGGAPAGSDDCNPLSRLRGSARVDLDAILGRALRREPERRYASATELRDDLERWLAGTPVRARDGDWRYRSGRFIGRHWLVLGLVTVTVLGLATATLISVAALQRADRAALSARDEAARARSAGDFMLELMREMRPGGAAYSPPLLMRRAENGIRARFGADPDTRAALLVAVGDLGRAHGQLDDSRRVLEEAADIAHARHGPGAELWLQAEASLGHTASRQGQYVNGIARLRRAIAAHAAAGGSAGPARIRALLQLAQLQQNNGDAAAALQHAEQAQQLADAVLDADHALRQPLLEVRGDALLHNGRKREARDLLTASLALARTRYGGPDLEVVSALEALAVVENDLDAPDAAEPLLLEARTMLADLLDRPHVMAAYVENTLGVAHLHRGQAQAARQAFGNALSLHQQLVASPHRMLVATHSNIGEAELELQRYTQAATAFDEAARQRHALDGTSRFGGPDPRCLAAEARVLAGALDAGITALSRCVDRLRAGPASDFGYLSAVLAALADAHWRRGETALAERAAHEALRLPHPTGAYETLLPRLVLARIAAASGSPAQLRRHLQSAVRAADERRWTRPCGTARLLHALADTAAAVEPVSARQLRERAERRACVHDDA